MNKTKIGYVCCMALLLLVAGCGRKEPAENLQEIDSGITETPEKVEVQDRTRLTEAPDAPGAEGESEKEEETDAPVEMELVEYTYPFYELWCAANAEASYEVTGDGACRVVFSAKYNKIIFALPEGINMALCDHVTVKARSAYGEFGVNLYDETVYINPWEMHVFAAYDFGGEGIQEFRMWPEQTCDVWGVGIISVDEVEDFSKYVVDVYSVTFHMKPGYQTDVLAES